MTLTEIGHPKKWGGPQKMGFQTSHGLAVHPQKKKKQYCVIELRKLPTKNNISIISE